MKQSHRLRTLKIAVERLRLMLVASQLGHAPKGSCIRELLHHVISYVFPLAYINYHQELANRL